VSSFPLMAMCTWYNIMWYTLSVTCGNRWCSPGTQISSTNKTDLNLYVGLLRKMVYKYIRKYCLFCILTFTFFCLYLFYNDELLIKLIQSELNQIDSTNTQIHDLSLVNILHISNPHLSIWRFRFQFWHI
jgi:hypothetical protein